MSLLASSVWLALYGPKVDGLLRYRDGSLHPYQPNVKR